MSAVVLYTNDCASFVTDALSGEIEEKLENAFMAQIHHRPSPSEKVSWRESLGRLGGILQLAGLDCSGISLEYFLPASSRRLDCMVAGLDEHYQPAATIVELKQWESCEDSDTDCEVVTRFKGVAVPTLHPSIQAGRYQEYLSDFNSAFAENPQVSLGACAYVHNYDFVSDDPLLAPKFAAAMEKWPIFGRKDHLKPRELLRTRVGSGEGLDLLRRIQTAPVRPTRDFLSHVGEVVRRNSPYRLLDSQVLVLHRVLRATETALSTDTQVAVIAKGGPGTGKSVIALHLMGMLAGDYHRDVRYVTGSGAFTKTLKRAMKPRAGVAFAWTNAFAGELEKSIDVLIVDEAHRIREFSTDRIGRRIGKEGELQVDEILRTGRVSVFFVDDLQGVTPDDHATSQLIRERAQALGIRVYEYELDIQFRCGGMGDFLPWIEGVLGIRESDLGPWKNSSSFEFRIFPTPQSLEDAILAKVSEGHSGRITAGYCWPWAPRPLADGTLEQDVQIGTYSRPWNARESATNLAPGIPKGSLWAFSPGGIGQIGCVYTAQGFEFDYVGVIVGPDLVFDPIDGKWVGNPEQSHDRRVKAARGEFTELAKRTYRVLLSRGLRGCYVHFMDHGTEERFRSSLA